MGVNERKAREKAEMRDTILAAARKIFLAKGWPAVSIRRIAADIEYSPGAIYLYFKDKDELQGALLEEGFGALRARQEQVLTGSDPLEQLRRHGEAYLDFALACPDFYELMFVVPVSPIAAAKAAATGAASLDLLRQNIAACATAGRLQVEDVGAATLALWGTVHGLASFACRTRHIPGASPLQQRDRTLGAYHAFFQLITQGATL